MSKDTSLVFTVTLISDILLQVALNWLISKDELIIPIPGAKNARQAQENAGAVGWRLTEEEQERIGQAAQPWLR